MEWIDQELDQLLAEIGMDRRRRRRILRQLNRACDSLTETLRELHRLLRMVKKAKIDETAKWRLIESIVLGFQTKFATATVKPEGLPDLIREMAGALGIPPSKLLRDETEKEYY